MEITVKQCELENIAADVCGLVSQALAIQDSVEHITIDKKRYENVDIDLRDNSIAFGLAVNLQKLAKQVENDLNALIERGGKWENWPKKCGVVVCAKRLIAQSA